MEKPRQFGYPWTLREIIPRVRAVLKEEGVRGLWFKLLGETIYRRAILMECPLDGALTTPVAQVSVQIDLLTTVTVLDYLQLHPASTEDMILQRLRDKDLCFIARYEGRIVHATWYATRQAWIGYLNQSIPLAADEVCGYETYTDPAFRRKNIASVRATYTKQYLHTAGYRRILAVVVPENIAGLREAKKVGYAPIGIIGFIKWNTWQRNFCRIWAGKRSPGALFVKHDSRYWNEVAQPFQQQPHYLDDFLGTLKRQTHLSLIERWGGVPADGYVLKTDLFEEALGPDSLLSDLTPQTGLTVGMDVSSAITQQAAQHGQKASLTYICADTRQLPFAPETFTLILSPSTLDHFVVPSDLGRSLRELARVLTSDGCLIITLDNRQNIFDPLLRLFHRFEWVPYYLGRSYRIDELCTELEAAGFIVQEKTAILHNPRLVAVASIVVANAFRWSMLTGIVHKLLLAAQRFEQTRWKYFTGSFIAAKAVRRS